MPGANKVRTCDQTLGNPEVIVQPFVPQVPAPILDGHQKCTSFFRHIEVLGFFFGEYLSFGLPLIALATGGGKC